MKKFMCMLVVLSVLLTSINSINVKSAQDSVSNPIVDSNKNISKYDVITFGSFWQSDFKRKDPIRWIVLKVESDGIKLISENNLDYINSVYAYNFEDRWHTDESDISLYKKINDRFYEVAFSKSEMNDIKQTVKNKNVLLPTQNEILQTYFGQSLKTNYCDFETSLIERGLDNWKGTIMETGETKTEFDGHCCYSVKDGRVYYNFLDPAIVDGLRPVIYIRKTSTLYKKVGVIGSQLQYFSPKATKISKVKTKKKALKITWNKKGKTDGVMGYKLQFSLSKKFKKAKTITVKKSNSKTKTIRKLKSKKKYYIRVKTYSVVAGKAYTSKWSKVKFKKTK